MNESQRFLYVSSCEEFYGEQMAIAFFYNAAGRYKAKKHAFFLCCAPAFSKTFWYKNSFVSLKSLKIQ